MEEIKGKLESLIKDIENINEILKSGGVSSFSRNEIFKKVEDGIFDNIHKASEYQLHVMTTGYKFQYYTEFNSNKELLLNEIKRRIRENKLNTIL